VLAAAVVVQKQVQLLGLAALVAAALDQNQILRQLVELQTQVVVAVVDAAGLMHPVEAAVLALLLFLSQLQMRHLLPQALQQLLQAVVIPFINLTLLVQLHSEVKHESLRKSC
jgi:hypothetical protein